MSFSLSTDPFRPADLDAVLAPAVDAAVAGRPADDEQASRELIAEGWAAARQLVGVVGRANDDRAVTVSIMGHATVGHGDQPGSSPETLTVSVSVAASDRVVEGTVAGGDPDAEPTDGGQVGDQLDASSGGSTTEQAQAVAEGTTSAPGTSGPAPAGGTTA